MKLASILSHSVLAFTVAALIPKAVSAQAPIPPEGAGIALCDHLWRVAKRLPKGLPEDEWNRRLASQANPPHWVPGNPSAHADWLIPELSKDLSYQQKNSRLSKSALTKLASDTRTQWLNQGTLSYSEAVVPYERGPLRLFKFDYPEPDVRAKNRLRTNIIGIEDARPLKVRRGSVLPRYSRAIFPMLAGRKVYWIQADVNQIRRLYLNDDPDNRYQVTEGYVCDIKRNWRDRFPDEF